MASPWINTMVALPAHGQWCIVRCSPSYGGVFRARYVGTGFPTNWRVNDVSTLAIPFYVVVRWRPE